MLSLAMRMTFIENGSKRASKTHEKLAMAIAPGMARREQLEKIGNVLAEPIYQGIQFVQMLLGRIARVKRNASRGLQRFRQKPECDERAHCAEPGMMGSRFSAYVLSKENLSIALSTSESPVFVLRVCNTFSRIIDTLPTARKRATVSMVCLWIVGHDGHKDVRKTPSSA